MTVREMLDHVLVLDCLTEDSKGKILFQQKFKFKVSKKKEKTKITLHLA